MKQALWAVLGLAALAVAMRVDYRTYRSDPFIWAGLGGVCVLLVLVLAIGAPVNGARRWFNVGGLGIQPSELAKLGAVFFTALVLDRRMHRIDEVSYSLLPIAIVVGAMFALIAVQPDMGTALALLVIVGTMIFAAGLGYGRIVGTALVALPVLAFVVLSAPYRMRRLVAFLDPWADPFDDGFQLVQSFLAVGTGGVFGLGLMGGHQKLFYLPEPHTDFIYAVISEELGMLGATTVLVCFCVIAWRGLRIALLAEDSFGAFLALGVTTMIAVQALLNISIVLGLLPTTGIPLPFVSSGGSSLLVSMVGVGVLLNVSQHEATEARG
jgi:cell division protein FtsW